MSATESPSFGARRLVVRYPGAPRAALDGVSMRVPPGSLYAVLGPNGSGKSTLLRGLLGVVPATSGEARVEGRPTGAWSRRDLARAVGVLPQGESVTFPIPVRDFVAMGRYPHLGPLGAERAVDRAAIRSALERCDAAGLASRDVTALSGGEFQRVRIARALAQEPRSLVLDEPTANLDIRHEMAIFGLLRQSASAGTTVLLITHNLNLAARYADRVLLLDGGRVAAEGSVDEVLTEEVVSAVYRWPVAVRRDPVSGATGITPLEQT